VRAESSFAKGVEVGVEVEALGDTTGSDEDELDCVIGATIWSSRLSTRLNILRVAGVEVEVDVPLGFVRFSFPRCEILSFSISSLLSKLRLRCLEKRGLGVVSVGVGVDVCVVVGV
jgi:hypothetical protein